MEKFEQASRVRLRFPINGSISVEQLWDVNEDVLIKYEEQLLEEEERKGKTSRRKAGRATKHESDQKLRLEIVSHVLDTLIAEREAEKALNESKKHNARIDELIARKKEAELESLSIEELEKLRK